ncbi:MAG: Crp/Fnr family transcriptional regulator [Pyrinomonadaceae bacterium]
MMPLDTSQSYYDSSIRESGESSDHEPELRTLDAADFPDSIKFAKSFAKGALIFVQGQPSKNIYVLTTGKVKLSTCSPVGRTMIVQIAGPGQILGLSSALCGAEHETSAEVVEPCTVESIETADLQRFLRASPETCLIVAKHLGSDYQKAHRQICALGLSDSVFDRVAKLLLSWSGDGNGYDNGNGNGNGNGSCVKIDNFFTHEEIAGMIGSSRETVTRTLKAFRERELITIKGREAIIHDRRRLIAAIGTPRGCLSRTDF